MSFAIAQLFESLCLRSHFPYRTDESDYSYLIPFHSLMKGSPEQQQIILFLASNPTGLRRVDQELRDVEEGLRLAKLGDQFDLKLRLSVRPRDIQRALLDEPAPQIVHFAGSGSGKEGLLFEDETGNAKVVDGPALAGLFELFTDQVNCVVLNGCYSEVQAKAIAERINYVIGMRQEISAKAAIEFAVGFYNAIGAGRSIEFAYKLGCSAIQMHGLSEHLVPVLLQKECSSTVPEQTTQLAGSVGRLWSVPELPPHFLPRPELLRSLKEKVSANLQQPLVMTGIAQRIGVQGMGGIGKSVLAAAVARDAAVQQAFPDGVFWVTVGIEPLLTTQQAELAEALGGKRHSFSSPKQGKARLGELLREKVCLLILDDVWDAEHADAFNALGSCGRLLITTRDAELITSLGAIEHRLDVLNDKQALELLAAWARVEVGALPVEARAVAKECGNLPLALSLCGAMARDLTPWEDLLDALQEADLGFIRKYFAHYPYPDILKTLRVSVEALGRTNSIAAERYQELAVFPIDELIPEETVLQLWQYTGNLKVRAARQILTTLASKGLLRLEGELPKRQVSLHDLQYDYLRVQQTDFRPLHECLLAAYQRCCSEGWHTGPKDGYFFEHLADHLIRAERQSELQVLLFDFRWIHAKLEATDINSLLTDYEQLSDDAELQLVQGALRLSAHVLNQDKSQLHSQLHGRLLGQCGFRLQILVQQIARFQGGPWLRCLVPSLYSPGGPLLRTLVGHTGAVAGVAISPDGRYAFSVSHDRTVKVWDLANGQEVRTLAGHTDAVTGVAISPDGCYALSASRDYTVKVWDLANGQEVRTLARHTGVVTGVAISPDGCYAFSASHDRTVKVWDLADGREVRTLAGHTDAVTGVAISPDGCYALSASRDYTVKVWDLADGREVRTLAGHTDAVTGVAISPDGRYAFSASHDRTVKVWDLANGQEVRTLAGHTDAVTGVAISSDGCYAFSASHDRTVKVWGLANGQEVRTLREHTNAVIGVAISPDSLTVVSALIDNTVTVWNLTSAQEVYCSSRHVHAVKDVIVSPDGCYALSASDDNTVKVWELLTGQEVYALTGHIDAVTRVAVSPDGRYALSASDDNTVKVWELLTGQEVYTYTGHAHAVIGVVVSPDGRYALSASKDQIVKIWELLTGQEVYTYTGPIDAVTRISVSPDGCYVLSASWRRVVKVWQWSTGQEMHTLTGHTDAVLGVAVSPDGCRVLSASRDQTVKVWELLTGQEVYTYTGHTDAVTGVVVSPNGRSVLSISWNQTLKLWDLSTGRQIANFTGNGALLSCAIAPDGMTIVVGESGGQIHFLQLEDGEFR